MKIVALDLGKFKTVSCCYDSQSAEASYEKIKTAPFVLHQLIARLCPDRVVFEVGPMAGWVHDVASSFGIDVQVANANHEGWRWRNVKRKSDRLDALKLARLSAMDQLPLVHIPSKATREHRSLIRYRCKLVSRRTRIKNTIRSLLHREAIPMKSGNSGWTRESLDRLRLLACPLESAKADELWRGELQEELDALASVEAQLSRVEAKLDGLARQDRRIQRLETIPCVGPRTAEMLVAVIDDPHRFSSGKQVGSYLGLTPRQYQSGNMDRSGRISKEGHRQLRRMLVEVSWLALRYNPHLRGLYIRLCRGSRSRRKIAIVAIARKLAVLAWAMLRDETHWNPGRRQDVA